MPPSFSCAGHRGQFLSLGNPEILRQNSSDFSKTHSFQLFRDLLLFLQLLVEEPPDFRFTICPSGSKSKSESNWRIRDFFTSSAAFVGNSRVACVFPRQTSADDKNSSFLYDIGHNMSAVLGDFWPTLISCTLSCLPRNNLLA